MKIKPTLSDKALYGPIGQIVEKLRGKTEASEAAILFQFIAAIGNCIGLKAHIQIGAQKHYPAIFICIVGNSAKARKGTSWSIVSFFMNEIDNRWSTESINKGLSSGEGLIDKISKHVEKKEDYRIFIIEPEFANVLRTKERSGNTLSAILRQLWDHDILQIMTRSEPMRVDKYTVGLATHITQAELELLMSNTDIFNGLANRILFAFVERGDLIPLPEPLYKEDFQEEISQIELALADVFQGVEVILSPQAMEEWQSMYRQLEQEDNARIDSLTSRSSPYVLRMAMILAIIDRQREIDPIHLEAAYEMWKYCETSAWLIFSNTYSHPKSQKLLQFIKDGDGLTRTQIHRKFNNHLKKGELDPILEELIEKKQIYVQAGDPDMTIYYLYKGE